MNNEIVINPDYKVYVHEKIFNFFNEYDFKYSGKEPIFVCIGTPTVSGDAVGPFVGDILSSFGYKVYGTSKKPVNAYTVNNTCRRLWIKDFLNSPIIALDASISEAPIGHVECVIGEGIKPGSAFEKNLYSIGNSAIRITVSNQPQDLYTRNLNEIFAIAKCVAYSIHCEITKRRQVKVVHY